MSRSYHSFLLTLCVLLTIALVIDSGIISSTSRVWSQSAQYQFANVIGISASIEPTELNQITAALTQKEQELKAREAALVEREIASRPFDTATSNETSSTYILSGILVLLLLLILFNYALDWMRYKETRPQKEVSI